MNSGDIESQPGPNNRCITSNYRTLKDDMELENHKEKIMNEDIQMYGSQNLHNMAERTTTEATDVMKNSEIKYNCKSRNVERNECINTASKIINRNTKNKLVENSRKDEKTKGQYKENINFVDDQNRE